MSESGAYRTKLHPELLDGVAEAFGWYEEQASGLGQDFTQAFYAAVSTPRASPC